jgi:hypothetical protein
MARKRKYNNSSVISIRISDEERQSLNSLMASSRIGTVSDLMRESIQLFKKNLPEEMQRILDRTKRPAYG